jgi:lipopolysaccharide/colanic/teichoic acid biosynthesis glycosyltransferase
MRDDFQDFLRESGEHVVTIGDNPFFLYNRGLIHANALPQDGKPAGAAEMRKAMGGSSALLLRWQEKVEVETEWWSMICRDTSISHMKRKHRRTVRKNIEQAQSDFSTRKATAAEVVELAYPAHVAAHERYKNASPLSPEEFSASVLKFQDTEQVEFWLCNCQSSGEVVGWAMFWLDSSGAFLHTVDIAPGALAHNAGYGFIYTCLDDYVEVRGLPVSNGTRPVSHATGMQDFLRKLGFHKEYSILHVEYPRWMRLLVTILMPVRSLVPHLGPLHLVRAVLDQEKLAQNCQGPTLASRVIKRSFDLLASTVMLLALSWLLLLCWTLASVDTRANGFFRQVRVGRHGKTFRLIKFRTMVEVEGLTTTVTTAGDCRITKLGGWLRRTKIDELPQLMNVFLGHMSLVGPRPDVPGWADQLTGEDAVILEMRPGITGPASLRFRNEEELLGEQQDPEAYNRDVIWPAKVTENRAYYYKQSLFLDFQCLLRTFFPSK